jgi:hypothetical protein
MQKENLEPTLKERVQFVPLDFFSGTPVKDCDIYYVNSSFFTSVMSLIFSSYVMYFMTGPWTTAK